MLRTFTLKNSAWDFFDVDFFVQGFVWWVSVGSRRDFWGFLFLPPFDHPCRLKSGVPPWNCHTASKFLWAPCLLQPF